MNGVMLKFLEIRDFIMSGQQGLGFIKHDLVNGEMIPKETWEHTITNPQKSFSKRGDSGSLVFERIKGKRD